VEEWSEGRVAVMGENTITATTTTTTTFQD